MAELNPRTHKANGQFAKGNGGSHLKKNRLNKKTRQAIINNERLDTIADELLSILIKHAQRLDTQDDTYDEWQHKVHWQCLNKAIDVYKLARDAEDVNKRAKELTKKDKELAEQNQDTVNKLLEKHEDTIRDAGGSQSGNSQLSG